MVDSAAEETPQEFANIPQGAVLSDAEIHSNPEISAPMLDVHAPYEPIHTWKSFVIHIATITIGLLIAIGLEQLVEYFHHRHQAASIAEKLKAESYENIATVRRDIRNCDLTLATIKSIVDILDQKPRASPVAPWTPPVLPEGRILKPSNAEWLIARDSALLQILPSALVANYWKIEITREHADAVYVDARRSRLKLNALLDVYAGQSTLNPTEAMAIRMALSEYAQYLNEVKRLLQIVAELNQITLDNKIIVDGKASDDIPMA
ncbi:MAG: hypothetical protein ACLPQI_14620 [Steroidobacteraceae bacterium]